ncbi:translation initiation factor IF-2, partial [Enterococcus faecium]
MGNKRIYELAKELKKSSKDVVEKAQQLGIDVKNHMGAITSSDEKKLQQAFKNPSTKQQAAQQASRKPANQQPNDQRKKETTNNQQKNKNNRSYQDRGQGSGQVNQGKKPTTNQNNTGNTSSQNRQGTSQGGNQNRTNNNNKPNNNNRGKFNNNNRNRYNKKGKKGKQQQSTKPAVPPRKFRELPDVLEYTEGMNVADIAKKIHREPAEIIKKLFMLGVMVNQNQALDKDTIELLATDYGMEPQEKVQVDIADIDKFFEAEEVDPDKLVSRPPVVTIMGHVDHGKTTLLDTLRHSRVTSGEAGGITQHIGAYQIDIDGKPITFLDTPGHAAFTSMRARGASITDITILVVAADDGVMPQTVEAINHAKAAGVPIIVAVNKIDKPGANPQHVMQELSEYELIPEAWGGETIFVEISAKFGQNIEELLEMILLVAEVEDLKA